MEELQVDTLTYPERREFLSTFEALCNRCADTFPTEEARALRRVLSRGMKSGAAHDDKGLPKALMALRAASAFAEMVDPDHNILLAIALEPIVQEGLLTVEEVGKRWGDDVQGLIEGLRSVAKFSSIDSSVDQDNFRGLMLSLADDIRVIIIMIVKNLVLMRAINLHEDNEWVRNVAFEANCLYAQLAHRLGLYKIKGELEDLSLKYTNREIYTQIAHKLNETKRSRDAYVARFIQPVREKLEAAGLKFDIKGRTKSISSIWNKMRKQKVDLDRIYDLFAIRVIIDTPPEKEKSDCWLAYSILADMYTPNPARMRDWISIPKGNGYESLHATVMGPESKWVEVQFRTRRMDLVAEKGLAAHWRYKGVKSDATDQWMNNIRDILETADSGPMQLMQDMRMDIYTREVFVFTPKGDLFRLPAGATVLDFAFLIHSEVGSHCTGAIVNGAHRKINHRLQSGDTVEIITSAQQTPHVEWLNIVVSSKSRNKIKQKLNEERQRLADIGKEALERRARNRKTEIDDARMMRLIKKQGYKFASEFFADMGAGKIDPGKWLIQYAEAVAAEQAEVAPKAGADEFQLQQRDEEERGNSDVLVIGERAINGLKYKFAKCCNPVYGDQVFGFISSDGVVKIHKDTCPNAPNNRESYPYRLIRVNWSGKGGTQLGATIRVVGTDDIGIVATLTSIISHESGVSLRNISVDSDRGVFHGYLTVGVSDASQLPALLRKLRTVKGVREVERV